MKITLESCVPSAIPGSATPSTNEGRDLCRKTLEGTHGSAFETASGLEIRSLSPEEFKFCLAFWALSLKN